MDGQRTVLAVIVLTSCVVVFWSGKNYIEKRRICLDDNNITISSAPDAQLPFSFATKDPVSSSSAFKVSNEDKNIKSNNNDNNNSINSNKSKSNGNKNIPIVETLSGKVSGKILKVSGSSIYTFIGIPYAEPPLGNLRFSRSVPVKPWDGVKSAIKFTLMCPQKVIPRELVPMDYISEKLSEDCLSLNIWTPSLKPKVLKTVMIWVHGGAFNYNSANLHETDGRMLASFGDVVVVTFNYRVGSFGFLDSGIEEAPGNVGIFDQTLALKWVRDNIERFGGDPNKLVPFGQSAGAISIGILMLMKETKGLFSRAITQSGGAFLAGVFFSKTRENAEKYAKTAGCADKKNNLKSNPQKVVACLKKKPLRELLKAEAEVLKSSQIAFVPTPNGVFKDFDNPGEYLEDESTFSNMKELLSGLVPDEGSWLVHVTDPNTFQRHSFPQYKTLEETREGFVKYSNENVGLPPRVTRLVAGASITGPATDTPINNIKRLYDAIGDNSIACPTIFVADEMVNRNKTVYMYLFNHRAKATKWGDWQGVSHYEEIPFVFGYPLRRPKKFSQQDIDLSKRIMKIWFHFAKTGQVLDQFNLVWPKYNDDESYMVLQPNKSSIIKSFHERSCEIYKASYPIFTN